MASPALAPQVAPADRDTGTDVSALLRITGRHAGLYVITDSLGLDVGTIRGDYVVGFTVRYLETVRWYVEFEQAKAAVAAEHQARLAVQAQAAAAS